MWIYFFLHWNLNGCQVDDQLTAYKHKPVAFKMSSLKMFVYLFNQTDFPFYKKNQYLEIFNSLIKRSFQLLKPQWNIFFGKRWESSFPIVKYLWVHVFSDVYINIYWLSKFSSYWKSIHLTKIWRKCIWKFKWLLDAANYLCLQTPMKLLEKIFASELPIFHCSNI